MWLVSRAMTQAVWKRVWAKAAKNCFLSHGLTMDVASTADFRIREIETKILLCKRASEFSHSLGQERTSFAAWVLSDHGQSQTLWRTLRWDFALTSATGRSLYEAV